MSRDEIQRALSELPHFRDVEPELLGRVAGLCSVVEPGEGETVFREGQRCDAFFVVLAGLVVVYKLAPDGREQVMHHIVPGQTFAEAALFHFHRFPASARGGAPGTRLLRVDGARFLELFRAEPALAASMVGSLCGWLHALLDRVEVLTQLNAGQRLASWVLRRPARSEGGRLVLELPLAKKDLAAELSITPETLSRLLAGWKERRLLEVDGKRLTLLDTRALQALADGGD
jgi:CRP/FNR family transcriptional regulator